MKRVEYRLHIYIYITYCVYRIKQKRNEMKGKKEEKNVNQITTAHKTLRFDYICSL